MGVLSLPFLLIGFEYNCTGQEMFPRYFASPFVFKSTSLATSLAYDYYFFGLLGNLMIWGGLIFVFDFLIMKVLNRISIESLYVIYKIVIGSFLTLSSISIFLEISVSSQSISWNANLMEEAKAWGMICKGEIVILK